MVIDSNLKIHNFCFMKQDKEILLNLAFRIKELRNEKGLTQDEVYNATGVHIARVEQGKRDVSYTTLRKLSAYFQVSLAVFD
jgi:predicted transcriptional regulator